MTPKEKAKRLVEIYTIKLPPQSTINLNGYSVITQGKLIASMVCDEVIKQNQIWIDKKLVGNNNYWNEVKAEIEKL